jgi:endonuclease YncB( thermonuclease family)
VIGDARSPAHFGVRLEAIQAPGPAHAFGSRAQQNLSALAFGRTVRVEAKEKPRGDGIVVGRVVLSPVPCPAPSCPTDVDLGLEQVRAGLAWWAAQRTDAWSAPERDRYQAAEFQAKIHRVGLWAGRDTLPPWQNPNPRPIHH